MAKQREVENNMTLRICKVIGYGIADITINDGTWSDDRLDSDGFLVNKKTQGDDKYHLQSFFDRLCEKDVDKWMVELYSMDYHSALLSDCIHHAVVNGKGTLTICPPNKCHVWVREDDVIDYCDEHQCHIGSSHFEFLGHGIPSYRYLMDKRSGRKVQTVMASEFLSLMGTYRTSKTDVEKYKIESTLAELACDLKFATIDEAVENIVPLVPDVVVEFCKFLRLFKNEQSILTLRPMILSYWR